MRHFATSPTNEVRFCNAAAGLRRALRRAAMRLCAFCLFTALNDIFFTDGQTLPGILAAQSFSLRPGQRAQPYARRVDVNAERFFQHRQIPVAGNDRAAFPLAQSRLNEFVVLGVAAHFFLKRDRRNPQG